VSWIIQAISFCYWCNGYPSTFSLPWSLLKQDRKHYFIR
jgi:hypothetical protein